MKLIDLLLLLAAVSFTVAGFTSSATFGCLALAASSVGLWLTVDVPE